MKDEKKVLVLCTGNSCRSIMAEALINQEFGDRWQAFSAGVKPSQVNPRAIQVMAEIGIDITNSYSKSVELFTGRNDFDLVVTVCDNARENCPVFPGLLKQVHLGFEDPALYNDQPDDIALPKFRQVRDEIKTHLLALLERIYPN